MGSKLKYSSDTLRFPLLIAWYVALGYQIPFFPAILTTQPFYLVSIAVFVFQILSSNPHHVDHISPIIP